MRLGPWILGALVLGGCFHPGEEGETVDPPPAQPRGVPLRLLDGTDDTPIAGARVTWCRIDRPSADSWFTGAAGPGPAELEARCAASGRSGVSDAEGLVRVTCERFERLTVTAAAGELWGQGSLWGFGPRVPVRELKLYPDGDLTVMVQGPDGFPARDVPVSLRRVHRYPRSDGSTAEWKHAVVSARSGVDGLATLRHARVELREKPLSSSKEGPDHLWSVGPDLCTAGREVVRVELRPWPESPVEITLPPLGQLELVLREPDGTPVVAEEGIVLTTEEIAVGEANDIALFRVDPADAERRSSVGGRVVFDRVGLGLDLVVFAIRNGASVTRHQELAGPREAGERVTAEIVFGVDTATFRARAVDESGEPLAGERLLVEYQLGPSPDEVAVTNGPRPEESWGVSWGFVVADGEGRFAVDFEDQIRWGGRGLVTVTHAIGEPRCLSARFDLTDRWGAGVHELGDLVLSPAPVLVAGTVVDPEGRALEGVWVGVSTWVREEAFPHLAVTDAEGRFAVRTAALHEPLDLLLRKPGFEREWTDPIEAGTEDLTIVLTPERPPDFGPIEGCSPARFAELEALAATLIDPGAGEEAGRAMSALIEAGKETFPVILNALRRLDLEEEAGFAAADLCRQVLEEICDLTFGWYGPEQLPDDYFVIDRAIIRDWREAWIRAEKDEEEWMELIGQSPEDEE